MPDTELKELRVTRASIKGRLTVFRNYLAEYSNYREVSKQNVSELKVRLKKVEALFNEYDSIQTAIEIKEAATDNYDDKTDLATTERVTTEKFFYAAISTAQDLVDKYSDFQSESGKVEHGNATFHNSSHCCMPNLHVKLPTLTAPTFDGASDNWLEYRDSFTATIHNNKQISDVNKFQYLKRSLIGGAASVIESLQISEATYEIAWKLVCERFDNKKRLVYNHLKSLFNMTTVGKEAESLRSLVDHISKHLRALNSLEEPTDNWDTLIIFVFSAKLDSSTSAKWEEHKNKIQDRVVLEDFYKFLRERANILEMMSVSTSDSPKKTEQKQVIEAKFKHIDKQQKAFVAVASDSKTNNQSNRSACKACGGDHLIYFCERFTKMSVEDRNKEVSKLRLCINCLHTGHFAHQCKHGPCKLCHRKHNTLLHKTKTPAQNVEANAVVTNPISLSTCIANQVLLSTATINIVINNQSGTGGNDKRKGHEARCLLDCGSQSSFITESLTQSLGIRCHDVESVCVTGINNMSFKALQYCTVTIQSRSNKHTKKVKAFVIPKITSNLPGQEVDVNELNIPQNISLADPSYYRPAQVDLLLGADVFWDVICNEQLKLGVNKPVLQNSIFGWLVVGPIMQKSDQSRSVHCNFSQEIQNQLARFWELEELPDRPALTTEEAACEEHFVKHTRRLEDGRFCVRLPLKVNADQLGNSYNVAIKRFKSLEARFRRQPDVKTQYVAFIKEYEELGHLSRVDKPEIANYLPHHPILKEKSESTKCRVVFDASAKTSSGLSLNDIMMTGPTIQDDIFSILIRFRQHTYIFTGDIEKMYRQILVEPSQRYLQTILWREDEKQSMKYWQLKTVTYGTSSAPFLSTRCIFQLGQECNDKLIKEIMIHDFMVDDLITGSDDKAHLNSIYQCITKQLESAKFNLRKIKSNCKEFLSMFESTNACHNENLKLSAVSNTLGIEWNPDTDCIVVPTSKILNYAENFPFTKRIVLSVASTIFDPLGLLTLTIVKCKMILQLLWAQKTGWDDVIPDSINVMWRKFIDKIHCLQTINIPRHASCSNAVQLELHAFSDASLKAYAACIYTKATDNLGNCTVRLLCAKTRVAPVKPTTIPRLELCGSVLVVRLCKKVMQSLRAQVERRIYWTDSQIVLGWLNSTSNKLGAFVSHRVVEINELSKNCRWLYVPSSQNPADLASRGVYPDEVNSLSLWWEGPSFLMQGEDEWPAQHAGAQTDATETIIQLQASCAVAAQNQAIDMSKYSSFTKLCRITAYVNRFIHNCRSLSNKNTESLTVDEIELAENKLVHIAQRESFPDFFTGKGKVREALLSLNPFIDKINLIRVGGRLDDSNYNYDKRHPVIIDSKHHFTRLLYLHYHVKLMHAGPQLLLSVIRERYWPINGRLLARRVYKDCIRCKRVKGAVARQIMGNLPAQRVSPGFPFEVAGTDYAGPFLIINKKGRGAKLSKCYLCIFVCFKVKAVHLELVSDLTTEAFILALRRFIARRGKPREIFSDNGKNFVGASRALGLFLETNNSSVSDSLVAEGIRFKFSPAYSPNFGGLYEAAVKSAKYHMKRVLGNAHMTFEELTTLFVQIEGILNSRPLSPLSSDSNDLDPLTPGHFLIGRPLTSLPAPGLTDINPNRLHRYARIEQARQHFWVRWTQEYICEMQQRTKWQKKHPSLQPGQLVLIKEESSPPLRWPLGRIERVFPGTDEACRVADVKTAKGVVRRAISRICPLQEV